MKTFPPFTTRFVPLLLLCALAPLRETFAAAHPSLPPPVVPECLGVNIHFTDPKPGEMEMLAAAGFKWVRMDLTWAGTERKAGEYDFSAYDRLVAALDQHKLRAVFILDYGNPLYAAPGDKQPFTSRAGTPEFREAFAKWAVAAVSHFQGRGTLWEMWNEPNHEGFWKPKANVDEYAALAKATGEALRRAGLVGVPPSGGGEAAASPDSLKAGLQRECFIGPATSTIDLPFLEACFKAGLLDYWDAVSVHPYRQTAPETVEEEYRSVRLLIRRYAPAGKDIPIISGEWGYSTQYPAFGGKDAAARDEQQAQWLARQFLTNLANDVALSIWYDWHDDGTNPTEPEHHFGIVAHEYHPGRDPVYDPKPAYTAMQTMTEQLGGFRFNKRLIPDPSVPTDSMCLFTNENEVKAVVWSGEKETQQPVSEESVSYRPIGERRVFLPMSAGEILSVGKDGRRRLTLRAEADGLLIAPESTVEYLTPKNPNSFLRLAAAWERAPLEFECEPPKQDRLQLKLLNVTNETLHTNAEEPTPIPPGAPVPTGSDPTPSTRLPTDYLTEYDPIFRPRHAYVALVQPKSAPEPVADETLNGLLVVAQPRLTLRQRFVAVVKNAVMARVFPPNDRFVPILIENRSGTPWTARLNFWYPSIAGFDSPGSAGGGQVSLAQGETVKIHRIPLDPLAAKAGCRIQVGEGDDGDSRSFGIPVSRGFPALTELQLRSDGDAAVHSKSSSNDGQPPGGPSLSETRSVRVKYQFGSGWKFIQGTLPGAKLSSLHPEPSLEEFWPKEFGLWLHGDGKGCQARIRFKDSTGQVFQPDGPKIDWKGWRYVTFPMQSTAEKPLAHWGGKNDGVIHYPIEWDSIFLLDNVSRQPVEGEIYLSAPTLIY